MKSSVVRLFAGVEGGGTKTLCCLISENGEILCKESSGPSNPWLLGKDGKNGFTVSAFVIQDLVSKSLDRLVEILGGKSEKELDEAAAELIICENNARVINGKEYRVEAVGMCLSGAGTRFVHDSIQNEMLKLGAKYKVYIQNDTLAPIFTAFENGGLVVISGTGSKCVLVNPISDFTQIKSFDDIASFSSGGWGNLLGDEGSAYWIAQKAIKFVIDYEDNFLLDDLDIYNESENSVFIEKEVEELKQLIFEHFQITTFDDLLPYFYSDFKKDFIASLTAKLAKIAENKTIIRRIFEASGFEIARHIVAILPKIDKKLLNSLHGLPIVCTGSVFKSWHLIKPGFVKCLERQMKKCSGLNEMNLVLVNDDSTLGAALLASRVYDQSLNLHKQFEFASLTTKLDHFYLKNIIKYNGKHSHLTASHYGENATNGTLHQTEI